MADKTIPDLTASSTIDTNTLFLMDTGIQTRKITAPNLAEGIKQLTTAKRQTFTAPGNFTVPSYVTKIRATATRKTYPFSGGYDSGSVWSQALDQAGNVWSWGYNGTGLQANGAQVMTSIPQAIINFSTFKKFKSIGFGISNTAYYLDETGKIFSCGGNRNGELGNNTAGAVGSAVSSPTAVTGAGTFKKLPRLGSTGNSMFAIGANGRAYAWGYNAGGELGVGDVTPRSTPTAVVGGRNFVDINSTWGVSFIGIDDTGAAYAWGANTNGQLGVGDVTPRSSPTAVLGGKIFKKVKMARTVNNSWYCVGLDTSGAMWAWGISELGNIGNGSSSTAYSSPVAVSGGHVFADFFTSEFSGSNVYGLDTNGALWAWGPNPNGEIGDGTLSSRATPVAVVGSHVFVKAWAFYDKAWGLDTAGNLWAWGANATSGPLGTGDLLSRSTPTAVVGGIKFEELFPNGTASQCTVLGADRNGKLWGWGHGQFGAHGAGTVLNYSSPTAVIGPNADLAPIAKVQPETFVTFLDVTPSEVLAVNLNGNFSKVGNAYLCAGDVDSIVIEW